MSAIDPLLRDLRRRLRTTSYRALSRELGISTTAIQRVLCGRPPGAAVAKALGWRIVYQNGTGHAIEAAALRDTLRSEVRARGGIKAAAMQLGVHASPLARALTAKTAEPAVYRALGFSVAYRKNSA